MAYTKNTWVDQDVERPKTYEVTNNQDGSITLTDSFGLVTELGTPVNAVNMNHIEDGIGGCAIRKHNLTETFNLGEWVLGGTGDDEGIYKSLIANNVGNAITDDTKWEKVEMGGSSRNVGEIISSTLPLTDAGLHLLDGTLLPYGIYKEFIDYIADLYGDGTNIPSYFCTESEWQTAVTTYGVCGKFVYDSTNNTVRLPKVTGIIEGTTDVTALGDLVEAGLPNIAASTTMVISSRAYPATGAFSWSAYQNKQNTTEGGSYWQEGTMSLNASRSSSLYKNNFNKVQPQTINVLYYIVIANSTKTEIQSDIDEIATDLNGKADTDLSNCSKPHIVETYQNGTSWYRVYSDGWCEQGGVYTFTSGKSSWSSAVYYIDVTTPVTFLKQFSSILSVVASSNHNQSWLGSVTYSTTAITSFRLLGVSAISTSHNISWRACGYIN